MTICEFFWWILSTWWSKEIWKFLCVSVNLREIANRFGKMFKSSYNVLQSHYNLVSTQCLNHCNVLQCHYNIVSTIVQHQISYKRRDCHMYTLTSLNPMPNAQVCVFDDTYYKITTSNYISKTSLYSTFPMYSLGPWPLKILMFTLLVTREIAPYSWYWYQNLGGAPPWARACLF